jgi:hypothetical protein
MPGFRAIEGGRSGGLDPRRAQLSRAHDLSTLGLAGSVGALLVIGFLLAAGQWGPGPVSWAHLALAALALSSVMCVVTIYLTSLFYDAHPRTARERRTAHETDELP